MAIYVPIVMYGLRLFIPNCLHILLEVAITSLSFVALHLLVYDIAIYIT